VNAKNRRWLIAGLTFFAGLYFLLEFLAPPTVPGLSPAGVLVGRENPSVTLEAGPMLPLDSVHQVRVPRIDVHGEVQYVAIPPREVRPGMTVRMAAPGFPADEDVVIAEVDYGRATLLLPDERRHTVQFTRHTVVLLHHRNDPAREIPLYLAEFGQTVTIGPTTILKDQRDTAAHFNSVIETMALGVGLISLAIVNVGRIRKREGDWYTALFFFGAVAIGVMAGLYKYYPIDSPEREISDFIILRMISAVGATIFSLLAFYMASAAYRAFRIRTREAALMMFSAVIVMIGQTPFGMYITGWMGEQLSFLWLPNVAGWLLRTPITAMFRGLIFGIMLGAIAQALRYWLSLERSGAMGE
jgi:hypothetical protein